MRNIPIEIRRGIVRIHRPDALRSGRWYEIRNADGSEAHIDIMDEIGLWGITADQFVKDLRAITAPVVQVNINSPGGDVFDGLAVYNALQQRSGRVVCNVYGLAASIASVIAMAGSELRMAKTAYLMIHDPTVFVWGGAKDLRDTADLLDKIKGTIVGIYAEKSARHEAGADKDELAKLMTDETWLTAEEAKAKGLCDCVEEKEEGPQNLGRFDLSGFAKVPAAIAGKADPKTATATACPQRVLRRVRALSAEVA